MAQVFPKSANQIAKASVVLGGVLTVAALVLVLFVLPRSSYVTRQREAREQPVPFYHLHHVGGMGIDIGLLAAALSASCLAQPAQTE